MVIYDLMLPCGIHSLMMESGKAFEIPRKGTMFG
jgi:hypothetical protein